MNNVKQVIISITLKKNMAIRLSCNDYGFECNFEVEGDDPASIIEKFGKHTYEEHGIEYSKEALMQLILRKGGG